VIHSPPLRPATILLLAAAFHCGGGGSPSARPPHFVDNEALPPSAATRFLPLADGTIWTYDLVDETGARGMIVTRARRISAARFELRTGGRARFVDFATDGVVLVASGTHLLKAPLTVGSTWPGEGGATIRVSATDRAMDVPAGKFAGCLETIEELGAAPADSHPKKRVTTVYCPEVGITSLLAEGWDGAQPATERATLRSFGAPVDIGAKPQ
jgi:hypothetical protein